jgi:hypothetical protein
MWLDECQYLGIEGSFFFLTYGETFNLFPGPNLVISRPFFDTSTGTNNSELDNFPGVVSGSKTVTSYTNLYGADANLRRNICCACNYRVDLVGGFRFMSLSDGVSIGENITVVNRPPTPAGTFILVNDSFRTTNEFYGGQFGFAGEVREGRAFVDFRGLLALGATVERTYINGSTSFTTPGGATATFPGGLLAQPPANQAGTPLQPSNIGNYQVTNFAVIPELGVNVGYQVTDGFRAFVGYSFMFWSNVVRAGEQIPTAVDSRVLPPLPNAGVAPPVVAGGPSLYQFHYNSLYVQGVSFGLEFRY